MSPHTSRYREGELFEEFEELPRWNPRYVAYARAHGRTPEDQLAHDKREYPGGWMGGFMVWMNQRWAEWRATPEPRDLPLAEHQAAFDAWLNSPERPDSSAATGSATP